MNKFYSIAKENMPLENDYQLKNLGELGHPFTFGFISRDGYGGRKSNVTTTFSEIRSEDYDQSFVYKLFELKPIYDIEKFIDYHYQKYLLDKEEASTFINHVKYIVLPLVKAKKSLLTESVTELIYIWLEKNSLTMKDNSFKSTSISGNNNVVNISSGNINQSNISITSSEANYEKLEELGVEKNHIDELKNIVSVNDKKTLPSKILSWMGDVTKSVAAKGLVENVPQITEFVKSFF
jgi:hypothetical protein